MYSYKIHHPYNFMFAKTFSRGRSRLGGNLAAGRRSPFLKVTDCGNEIFHLSLRDKQWSGTYSQAGLPKPSRGKSNGSLTVNTRAGLRLTGADGTCLLKGSDAATFGFCGQAWMLQFEPDKELLFYGMGEKMGPLEKTRKRTKFWNMDVWADFSRSQIESGNTDPHYASIPYLVIRKENTYIGILLDNPFATFMSANGRIGPIANQMEAQTHTKFYVGSEDGQPGVWILVGPTLAALTRKFQQLIGTTPLPPLWALGHHQCRWGYKGTADLQALDEAFTKYGIPTDGLWLDIDYMDGYRVFTFSKEHFTNVREEVEALRKQGRHIVPIIDPGVKNDKRYRVCRDGMRKDTFCKTPEGAPYIGFVWPGDTLFPDFSEPAAREWWAEHAKRFFANGFSGAWLDMNDPSVGPIELDNMCFGADGSHPHATFHNQYGLGMAMATHEGFTKANPDKRPFLLSRSGFIGSQRYTAIWTGDNLSSDTYLAGSIPCSINLALSGIPFNGPDVPGFGRDATAELAECWYKAGFLFPFLRNHSCVGTHDQEPWAFGTKTRRIIKHYIQLRYKLLPYIYNLFIDQEEQGEAIMRPLFYDFADTENVQLSHIDDQYLLGPAIMNAPLVQSGTSGRQVVLPEGDWYDARTGKWLKGDRVAKATTTDNIECPLYIRSGQIVPMLQDLPETNTSDLSCIELHLFLKPSEQASYTYRCDAGEGFAYRDGERTSVTFRATVRARSVELEIENPAIGWKPLAMRVVTYGKQSKVICRLPSGPPCEVPLSDHTWRFTGSQLACRSSAPIHIL